MKARLYILLGIVLAFTSCEGLDIQSKLIDPTILPSPKIDTSNTKPKYSRNAPKSVSKNISNFKEIKRLKENKEEKPSKEVLSKLESHANKQSVKPKSIQISLTGLSSSQLDEKFGSPNLIRIDGKAELRVYLLHDSDCSLYAFLYSNITTNAERTVKHYETRGPAENTIDQCARSFANSIKPD